MLIESAEGIKIQCDPYDDTVGYRVPEFEPDIVTVSHDHFDHNAIDFTGGSPEIIREPGDFNVKGIKIKGVESFHDDCGGRKRGKNIIYRFTIDNMNFVHMGDIGHTLDEKTIRALKPCDIVAVPVGGRYTVGGRDAADIVKGLSPSAAIPVHYDTPSNKIGLADANEFLSEFMEIRRSRAWEGRRKDLKDNIVVEVLMALGEFKNER